MEQLSKITISGKEYDIPEGIVATSNDGLFSVDWSLLKIAPEFTEGTKEFKFFNPRHLGQFLTGGDTKTPECPGQGFDKESMRELLSDLQGNGLDYPLLGYWVVDEGVVKVCINDGERRWLCIDRMRDDKVQVWSNAEQQFLSAREVYASVPCRVKTLTEEEALQRACTVTNTAVKWGDAVYARLTRIMYDAGKSDDEIAKFCNKGKNWLADTYSLNELDDFSFKFLLEGKINRKVALDLVKIKDVEKRKMWLTGAWQDALDNHEALQAQVEKSVDKAESQEELAQAELEEAKLKNAPPEEIAALEKKVEEAGEKTTTRKQAKAASAKPMVKSKNLRRAAGGAFATALRAPKIKKKLLFVQELIQKNDTSQVDMKTLKVLEVAYQSILDGVEDIAAVIKKLI